MLERMKELKFKNAGVAEAEAVYAGCEAEIEMFRRHSKSYVYAFFVLQRIWPLRRAPLPLQKNTSDSLSQPPAPR